jgi:uncharacterized protein YigE (DUF2233 family)
MLILGAVVWAAVTASTPTWQAIGPGAERLQLDEDDLTVELWRFDLARYRAEVVVPGPAHPKTASVLRSEGHAVAAVNGGFFDERGRSLGLRISAGKMVVPLRPRVDWGVLLVRDGRAQILHSRELKADPAIEQAIQVGPRLVTAGQALRLKPQWARRTAVALDREGRTLTLVIADAPADAQRLADALARLGFDAAIMLDGGPSTQLAVEVGNVRRWVPGGYGVPDGLVIRPR